MSAAHVCDECKRVAPLDENLGWWNVDAANTLAGQLLSMIEKPSYSFCSWACLSAFSTRMKAHRGASA